jgi:hypothetical protein
MLAGWLDCSIIPGFQVDGRASVLRMKGSRRHIFFQIISLVSYKNKTIGQLGILVRDNQYARQFFDSTENCIQR